MSRISAIIAFQTKKSNPERDLRKETDTHAQNALFETFLPIDTNTNT